MLATFCLRLACGLMTSLLLLFALPVSPRFYLTQFRIVLALTGLATVALSDVGGTGLWIAVTVALAGSLLGSIVWSLERSPAGYFLVAVTVVSQVAALAFWSATSHEAQPFDGALATMRESEGWLLVDELTSAAVLGTATTAMLTGHSYLVAPSMTLAPLVRLLGALGVAVVLRMTLAAFGLWSWTRGHSLGNLEDVTVLWLPLRWALGFAGPLLLTWMAYSAARIRSTQSATGILYVVVIFCFLGELTSLLLLKQTHFIL